MLPRPLTLVRTLMSYPKTAQTISISKTGGVEVLEKSEVPLEVKPDHIVVKINYLGVNFIDTYHRSGLYPLKSFPATLGMEAAGTIIALPTDPSVLSDEDYKKRSFQLGSKVAIMTLGAYASHLSVPWTTAYPVPANVSARTAAAALLQGLTTVTFTAEAYAVRAGDAALVHTVAGGLGLLLAQRLKGLGARVIGTTSSADKARAARDAGADAVVLYKQEDVVGRVLEFTDGQGVDVIYDGVGKDTFENDFKMIKRKGTLVAVGNASGPIPPFSPLKLSEKNVKLVRPNSVNYLVTPAEKLHYGTMLFDLLAKDELKVKIHAEYEFTAEGLARAHSDLVGGKTIGKLVVKVAEE